MNNKKKIKIFLCTAHGKGTSQESNPQSINAYEIAKRLDKSKFEVGIFYDTYFSSDLAREGVQQYKLYRKRTKLKIDRPEPNYLYNYLFKILPHWNLLYCPITYYGVNILFWLKSIIKFEFASFTTIEGLHNKTQETREFGFLPTHIEFFKLNTYRYSISKYVQEYVSLNWGIDDTKILYTGIDLTKFPYIKREKRKKRLNIIFVGSLSDRKRPWIILNLAKYFRNFQFTILGDGPLKNSLLERQNKENIGNVEFKGYITNNSLWKYYKYADIFILPSLSEGFPKVSLEAASTGLPLILFDNYKPESVIDGYNGFIAKNDDDLIYYIERLTDPNLREELGRNSYDLARKFDWNIIIKDWEREIIRMYYNL